MMLPRSSPGFRLAVGLVVAASFSGGGCKRKHVDGTVAVDTVLKEWRAGGFTTDAVESIEPEPWNAGACSRGAIGGLDVLMCEYATDESLLAGERKVMTDWEAEGVSTGAVVRTSKTFLAVADRTKVDPNGRTIQRLIASFREQR